MTGATRRRRKTAALLAVIAAVAAAGLQINRAAASSWTGAWTQTSATTAPSPRADPAMAGDGSDPVLLFGGEDGGSYLADTWTWSASQWTRHTPATAPSARFGAALAYGAGGTAILFGGQSAPGSYLGDTWRWDGTGWTRLSPAHSPPAREGAALAYDGATGVTVLFGGFSSAGLLGDTWTWSGTDWTQGPAAPAPPARADAAMAYDAATGQVVLFGGQGLADTWTWTGAWTQAAPSVSPPGRADGAMAYDAGTGAVVLTAGYGSAGFLADAWAWQGGTWWPVAASGAPVPRMGPGLAAAPGGHGAVMFGGLGTTPGDQSDTWTLALTAPAGGGTSGGGGTGSGGGGTPSTGGSGATTTSTTSSTTTSSSTTSSTTTSTLPPTTTTTVSTAANGAGAPSGIDPGTWLPACRAGVASGFVCQAYADLLHRPADAGGLAAWTAALAHGWTTSEVAAGLMTSAEYRSDLVGSWYASLLHRSGGAGELSGWAAVLGAGASYDQVRAAIASSAEYYGDAGATPAGFVSALYRDLLHRSADPTGLVGWQYALARGASRAQVVSALEASAEFRAGQVAAWYQAYLGRPASAGEAGAWGAVLGATGPVAVVAGVMGSPEYLSRAVAAAALGASARLGARVVPAPSPVYADNFPDPSVLWDGQHYWAYGTQNLYVDLQVMSSSNLTTWASPNDALPTLPSWAGWGLTWAPSVARFGSTYVMWYTVHDQATGEQCISVATASTPAGPFTDASSGPAICQAHGSIDPNVYLDGSTPYLVWKSDDNSAGLPTHLWAAPLTSTGRALATSTYASLLGETTSWQSPAMEGPTMARSGNLYYLAYAGGNWDSASNAIGYAICRTPLGWCVDESTTSPWMTGTTAALGPGGPSFFTDAAGTLRLAYYAWDGCVGYPACSRALYIGTPTFSSTGVPGLG